MFSTVKINDEKVKPVRVPKTDVSEIKGGCLFRMDSRIFLCARSRSGKTTAINTIIRKCSDKNTKFYIFAPTVDTDPIYVQIQKYLNKRGNHVEVFNSLTIERHDMLKDILNQLNEEKREKQVAQEKKSDKPMSGMGKLLFDEPEQQEENEKAPRKPKMKSPELFFILDDLGQQLRNSTVSDMLKLIRHYSCKFIISTQYPNDVRPEGRNQCDYLLIFKGHDDKKIEELYKNFNIGVPFDDFLKIYHDATKEKYGFLYYDKCNDEFRKNFDLKYNISPKPL